MKKICLFLFCIICMPVYAQTGVQLGVGVSGITGFNVNAGFYNSGLESVFFRRLGVRVDFADSGALKSAIDSAIDSAMRDGVSVGDGVKIDNGKLDAWHASLLLDYYPFSGVWRLTGGYTWGAADLSADIYGKIADAPNEHFYFNLAGDYYYYNGNNFGGSVGIDWNFRGPYVGTGFDVDLFCGFGLFFDVGVVFTNRPAKLSINIPHEQLYMYNRETGTWSPIVIPKLDSNVAQATRDGNKKLADFKLFPMIKVGFVYHF